MVSVISGDKLPEVQSQELILLTASYMQLFECLCSSYFPFLCLNIALFMCHHIVVKVKQNGSKEFSTRFGTQYHSVHVSYNF